VALARRRLRKVSHGGTRTGIKGNEMGKYEPRFDLDFSRGLIGEHLVETFLADLVGKKIEVKTDYRVNETGNVYVETWQYSQPDTSDKKQSGINVSEAEYYCFGSPSGDGFIMIKTSVLKEFIRNTNPREARQTIASKETKASIGRLIPLADLLASIGLAKKGN
jgi:hypothetical protein